MGLECNGKKEAGGEKLQIPQMFFAAPFKASSRCAGSDCRLEYSAIYFTDLFYRNKSVYIFWYRLVYFTVNWRTYIVEGKYSFGLSLCTDGNGNSITTQLCRTWM